MRFTILAVSVLVIGFSAWVSAPQFWFPLNNMSQKAISDMYPSAITPAPFTFSIWSVIYCTWIILWFVILFSKNRNTWIHEKAVIPLAFAVLLTAVWLIPWSYLWIGTSLFIILLLLFVLKYVFHLTRQDPLITRTTVELFLWWINIATVANITIWLLSIWFRWWNIPHNYWAIGVIWLAFLLTLYYQFRYQTHVISAVFLWAMFGISMNHDDTLQRNMILAYSVCILIAMVSTWIRNIKHREDFN